jgi:hypothetical protein
LRFSASFKYSLISGACLFADLAARGTESTTAPRKKNIKVLFTSPPPLLVDMQVPIIEPCLKNYNPIVPDGGEEAKQEGINLEREPLLLHERSGLSPLIPR